MVGFILHDYRTKLDVDECGQSFNLHVCLREICLNVDSLKN